MELSELEKKMDAVIVAQDALLEGQKKEIALLNARISAMQAILDIERQAKREQAKHVCTAECLGGDCK